MKFVPTVTIDGSQGTQALILKNLYLEVCKVLSGGGPMPKGCEDNMWWWMILEYTKYFIWLKDLYFYVELLVFVFRAGILPSSVCFEWLE